MPDNDFPDGSWVPISTNFQFLSTDDDELLVTDDDQFLIVTYDTTWAPAGVPADGNWTVIGT